MWRFVFKVVLYIQAAQRPVKEKRKKKNQVFHATPKFHAWTHEAHAWRKASYRSCDSRRVSWVHQRGWSRSLQLQSGPQRPSLLSGRQGEARGWCCRRNLSRPNGKHDYSVQLKDGPKRRRGECGECAAVYPLCRRSCPCCTLPLQYRSAGGPWPSWQQCIGSSPPYKSRRRGHEQCGRVSSYM